MRLLLLGALLAGAVLVVGAGASSAWENNCDNEPNSVGGLSTGNLADDIYVDAGVAFVGVDLEQHEIDGDWGPMVCINNEMHPIVLHTTDGLFVHVEHCTAAFGCQQVLGATGLRESGTTTVNVLPATTVNPGYDVWVDGTNLTP